jgi:hypothetical protein
VIGPSTSNVSAWAKAVPEKAESAAARAKAEVIACMEVSLLVDFSPRLSFPHQSVMPGGIWQNGGADDQVD